MNTQTSSNKVRINDRSAIIICKEAIKRYWVLAAVELIILFLGVTSQFFFTLANQTDDMHVTMASWISNLFSFGSILQLFLMTCFAILSGLFVFSYLHRIPAVTAFHMLPVNRRTLFFGHYLAGLLLSYVPFLINGLIIGIIDAAMIHAGGRAFIIWLLISLLIQNYVYSITVFAGMLCGTSLMHVIGALGLNFLVPAITALIAAYSDQFLPGFTMSGFWEEFILNSTPCMAFMNMGSVPWSEVILFAAILTVINILSAQLYKHRQLEKATDPLAYRFMDPIVIFLLTFVAMSLIMLYFSLVGSIWLPLIIGFIICFFIASMIVYKTPNVFNFKSLKLMGIFVLIIGLFVASMQFDLFGYSKRVPQADKVEYASTKVIGTALSEASDDLFCQPADVYNADYYDLSSAHEGQDAAAEINGGSYGTGGTVFFEEESIQLLSDLMQEVREQDIHVQGAGGASEGSIADGDAQWYIPFDYIMKEGVKWSREYELRDLGFAKKSENLQDLYESKEFKKLYSPAKLKPAAERDKYKSSGSISQVYTNQEFLDYIGDSGDSAVSDPGDQGDQGDQGNPGDQGDPESAVLADKKDNSEVSMGSDGYSFDLTEDAVAELLNALGKDFQEKKMSRAIIGQDDYLCNFYVEWSLKNPKKRADGSYDEHYNSLSLVITKDDKNAIKWLEDKGIYDDLIKKAPEGWYEKYKEWMGM